MRMLIGTTNPGKAKELEGLLRPHGFSCVTLTEAGLETIEETGATFEENAVMKAEAYAKASGLPTLADDGGLEIDALAGAPGVRSHRWAGDGATDLKLFLTVLERMKGVPANKRTARLRTVVALASPDGATRTASKAIEGRIVEEDAAEPEKISPGFPYRALLVVEACGKLFSDLTDEEHARINHRHQALQELLPLLEKLRQAAGA